MNEGSISMGMTTDPINLSQPAAKPLDSNHSPLSPNGKLPRVRRRGAGGLVWKLPLLGIVVAGALYGGWHWYLPDSSQTTEIVAVVTRSDLPIIVTERGDLES